MSNNTMSTDTKFLTNESGQGLLSRFKTLITNTRFFDVLVGYFYTSGFYALAQELEKTEKIRILVGMGMNREAYQLVQQSQTDYNQANSLSDNMIKETYAELVQQEMANSPDTPEVEKGIQRFCEWLKSGKLEIKVYPSHNLHAKLYIMTFPENYPDRGRVITGSSNFTMSGLEDNLEFNVELKDRSDYEFAKQKFEELWDEAIDVSPDYIQTIHEKTWLRDNISPYELYLKFLYEYFREDLDEQEKISLTHIPERFKKLQYQTQAVLNAKKILEEYGGVFLSDVVGLGKTYIAAMLASQLDGKTLVIAPPVLLEKSNPGSWPNVIADFLIPADFISIGKLDDVLNSSDAYKNVIIDEAHRFRNEATISYEKLSQICRGKRVILVTATPYNNSPKDILNLIKLFQSPRQSNIPNMPNLESFFNGLDAKLKNIDRQKNYEEYIKTVQENAKEIREKVLKYLIVRRTRTEIMTYFKEDLEKQNLRFPEIAAPTPLYYQFNEEEEHIFNKTMRLISQEFTYARYTPLLYYKRPIGGLEEQSQRNMRRFMKILLVKRLESSFYAFKNSLERFLSSYKHFIDEFKKGYVYISKQYTNKIFEYLEDGNDEAIQKLIDEDKANRYPASEFSDRFLEDLEKDFSILKEIHTEWQKIKRDPKLETFLTNLRKNPILQNNKLIIFTESKETAEYLTNELNKQKDVHLHNKVLCFTGTTAEEKRSEVIENFDANVKNPRDDYRILVATEVLAEGINLHRANVVINYDIPWNPTRMMQRVGRINRVDTPFDTIYTFTFFPTAQANNEIGLKQAAEAKIHAFLTLLGGDAALLTEEEPIGSHELFDRLTSRTTLIGEEETEESELKYLSIIREIREGNPKLFEKIKALPKKARSAKSYTENALITYFRYGKLHKFYKTTLDGKTEEVDFITAAKILETSPNTPKEKLPETFFDLLEKNKAAFAEATTDISLPPAPSKGNQPDRLLQNIIKAAIGDPQISIEDRNYLQKVLYQLIAGAIPKRTIQQCNKQLGNLTHPAQVLQVLKENISERLLVPHTNQEKSSRNHQIEVILSLYLKETLTS